MSNTQRNKLARASYSGPIQPSHVYLAEFGDAEYAPDRGIDNRGKELKDRASVGTEFAFTHPCFVVFVHDRQRLALVIPITSRNDSRDNDHMCIELNDKDYSNTSKSGLVLCHHIRTIDRARFLQNIGIMKQDVANSIRYHVRDLFQHRKPWA